MFKKLRSKKGFWGMQGIALIMFCLMSTVTVVNLSTPAIKDNFRVRKAEQLCQGASMGYVEDIGVDELGNPKIIASLADVVNEDKDGIMNNVPKDIVDFCHDQVAKMSKEDILKFIADDTESKFIE